MTHQCSVCFHIHEEEFIHNSSINYMLSIQKQIRNTRYLKDCLSENFPIPSMLYKTKNEKYLVNFGQLVWEKIFRPSKEFRHKLICKFCISEIIESFKNMLYPLSLYAYHKAHREIIEEEERREAEKKKYEQKKVQSEKRQISSHQDDKDHTISRYYDSPLEIRFVPYLALTGLHFQAQAKIANYRVDFLIYDVVNYIIEIDGHEWHSSKQQRQRDYARERALQSMGYKIIRFTGSDIYLKPMESISEIIEIINNDRAKHHE